MSDDSFSLSSKEVNDLLDRLSGLGKTHSLMARIGQVMVDDTSLNFRHSQSPEGKPWEPLKHRTGRPLSDTRRLRNSISYSVNAAGDLVSIGTNVPYATTHQYGATIKPKNPKGKLKFSGKNGAPVFAKKVVIPARKFIGIHDRQVNKINSAIDQWAERILTDGYAEPSAR